MSVSVLVVTNAYPDFPDSYHGIFVRSTAERLAENDWHSHVLAPRIYRDSSPAESFPTHDVTRFPFPTAEKLLIEYDGVPVFRIAVMVASGLLSARKTIRRHGCRLIHAHWAFPAGVIALAASRLTGLPLMLTVHGSDWRLAAQRGGIAKQAFLRVARASARIISVSSQITDWLVCEGEIPPERIATHPVGVDLDIFEPGEAAARKNLPRETVVSTRNLTSLYQVADLVEAAAQVKEQHPGLMVNIAGDGPMRGELEQKAAELTLEKNVSFRGRIEQNKLAQVLENSRVYVSTSPAEGTSISLLEAMAAGCLPVVTDIPPNREWVTHERNGLLFPAGDSAALAACLERAFSDDALRDAAATEGPQLVNERGSFAGHTDAVDKCYRDLAGK